MTEVTECSMPHSIDQTEQVVQLQSNKQGYKRCMGRAQKVGNTGEIRRWFHYQLQDAYDLVHVNSEKGLQIWVDIDLYSPTKCHDRLRWL